MIKKLHNHDITTTSMQYIPQNLKWLSFFAFVAMASPLCPAQSSSLHSIGPPPEEKISM